MVLGAELLDQSARGPAHPRLHQAARISRRDQQDRDRAPRREDVGQHPHRAAGDPDRQARRRRRRAPARSLGDDQERGLHQHPRGAQGRDRRAAHRGEHRAAARAPRRVPARDEEGDERRAEVRRTGREGEGRGTARRRRDVARGAVHGRARAAPHAARPNRVRLLGSALSVRRDRREVLDLQRPRAGREAGRAPTGDARRGAGALAAAERTDATAQANQVPEGPEGPHARQSVPRQRARVRRVRPAGARPRARDRAPDRGRARRDDPPRQTRRQDLDPHLPRQADDQAPAGNAHGQRQGQSRVLGLRREAGTGPVQMEGVDRATAREALRLAAHKIGLRTRILERHEA